MTILPLLSLSLLLLSIQTSYSSPTCESFKCGDINISYPFSHYEKASNHCGVPGFLISCENTIPILHLKSENYTVLDINYDNRTITLVDTDVLNPNVTCPIVQNNVSFFSNSGVTYTASDVNLTFYFECDSYLYNGSPITCLSDSYGDSYVFLSNETSLYQYDQWAAQCKEVVVAPVINIYPNQYNLTEEFGLVLKRGFQLGWSSTNNCIECQKSKGQCGYTLLDDNTTYQFKCFCANGSCGGKIVKRTKVIIVVGIALGTFSILFALFILCFLVYQRKHEERKRSQTVEATLENFGILAPKRYPFSEIRKITKSFNQKIGQGGYASVFKGELTDGSPVAVKVFKDRESNGVEFTSEVVSIARTSHINIVRLLGFSIKGSKRALIYEFMPNGSLDKYLRGSHNSTLSDAECTRLFEIAVGIARGLEYLHRGCNTRIVHFDIKPHNILLDQDYCPKISDFGLAKFCQLKESIISMSGLRGTIGYIAPEVFSRNFGTVSSKSDVYSYGMMVLEMFGAKQGKMELTDSSSETYFPNYIYKWVEQNNICSVYGVSDVSEEIVRKVTIVGLWCIQMMPHSRPTMSVVLDMLERRIEDLTLPPPLNVSLHPVLVHEATELTASISYDQQ